MILKSNWILKYFLKSRVINYIKFRYLHCNILLMKYRSSILLLLVFCYSFSSWGQDKNDTIKTEKLIIIKQYSPTLNDAFKVRSKPAISDSIKKSQKTVEYSIFSVPVASTFTPVKGSASNVTLESRPYLYQNYARVGVGNFTNILGEFYGNVYINRYQKLNIDFNHLSSAGGIEDEILDNDFMDTSLDLSLESSENYFTWNAGIGVDIKRYNWYGFDEDNLNQFNTIFGEDISAIDPSQNYLGINLNGGIDFQNDILKTIELKVQNFTDQYDSSENEVDISSAFQFNVSNNNLDVDFGFNYLSGNFDQQYNDPDNGIKYGFLTTSLQPSMQFEFSDLVLDVGLKGVYLNDTELSESEFFVYPKIKANYKFTDEFMLYAGLDGDLTSNSYSSIVDENPFVSPTLFIQPTDNALSGFAGVNGKVKKLSYNIKAFYTQENNYAFFIENPTQLGFSGFQPQDNYEYSNSFRLFYDDLTSIGAQVEANYEAFDDFNLGFSAQYFNFSVDNLPEASYLPEFKVNLNANYQIGEKWFLHSTLFYVGERESVGFVTLPADGIGFGSETVEGFLDINFGIDYQLSERLGIFVTGRNLLNNNYQQWRNFDVQGIQVMGGISYQFDW